MNMNRQEARLYAVLISIFLILSLSSCRFTVPNASEGQALVSNKTFPGAPPAWIRQPEGEKPRIPADAGTIPQSFKGAPAARMSSQAMPDNTVDAQGFGYEYKGDTEAAMEAEKNIPTDEDEVVVEGKKEISPLERIEQACPGIESSVVDALKTTEASQRIQKYTALTSRCPYSADLWLWLGKDYRSENQLVEASRCFEQVLTIDHSNEVARALLAEVQKSLNEAGSKK